MLYGRREIRDTHRYFEDCRSRGNTRRFYEELRTILRAEGVNWNRLSIRTMFEETVPDGHHVLQSWHDERFNGNSGRYVEGPGDALDTAAFSNLLGQVNYAATLQSLDAPQFIGRQLVRTVPAATQYTEMRPGVGKYGDVAESVGEGMEYPIVRPVEEYITIPEKIKDGFIVPWTREIVMEDNIGLMARMNEYASESMAITWERELLDMILGVTTSYSRNGGAAQATYGDTHTQGDFDNLSASTPLKTYADIETALDLLHKITDPNTGDPVNIGTDVDLIVPTKLAATAGNIVNAIQVEERTSGTDNTNTTPITVTVAPNPVGGPMGSVRQVWSSQFVYDRTSSDTTWFIGDFQRAVEYVESWAPDFVTMDGNSHQGFWRDIVGAVKISRKGTPAMVEPRRIVKCTA